MIQIECLHPYTLRCKATFACIHAWLLALRFFAEVLAACRPIFRARDPKRLDYGRMGCLQAAEAYDHTVDLELFWCEPKRFPARIAFALLRTGCWLVIGDAKLVPATRTHWRTG